ncbi:hypothetical protein HOP60_00955 [Halomonas daqingensis]|uniref:Uncharacterized protein n=1 Tax=Billgrantia desiderata TaxID=52021 RepID=A0ABS9AZM9_9GAMM|nr:hypothetical protein [Halomonas desiderata]MCE8040720.1 hypothetical protein [Halomonas desiderata]MCE8045295.1 hypothetical protein [Halomonas desiderata]
MTKASSRMPARWTVPLPFRLVWLVSMLLSLAACATQPGADARIQAGHTALHKAGFIRADIDPALLTQAWVRNTARTVEPETPWHIYIEGDGLAWQSRGRPSANPTPITPVALHLATQDPSPRVAYLGRPCQFFSPLPEGCHHTDWTQDRYAPRQAERLLQAMQVFSPESPVIFIGYSGGAHLAVQLSARYPHTEGIVTVAGNLDNGEFSRFHRIAQHNAAETSPTSLPIWSLSGKRDDIIPPALAERMLQRVATNPSCRYHQIDELAEHSGPWQLEWERILPHLEQCSTPR